MNTMYDTPCDCGMCGVCREQWEYEQSIERSGWHTPPASEELCSWKCQGCKDCGELE